MKRSDYIGSSDAIDLVAGNWDEVYDRKINPPEEDPLDDVFKVQLGKFTEVFHIDWAIKRLKEAGEVIGGGAMQIEYLHPCGFVACHADGSVMTPDEEHFPIEVKHTGGQRSQMDLINFYMPQLQHILMCSGRKKLVFSAIHGNEEPEINWIGASEEYQSALLATYSEFWTMVHQRHRPVNRTRFVDAGTESRILDAVTVDGQIRVDMSSNNFFNECADNYAQTKEAAKLHDTAKKELKAMMTADIRELYSDKIVLRRSKSGSVLFREPEA